MKTNISLICLLPNYGQTVAKILAEKVDMFYADVEDMFDFELGDLEHILNVLGDKDGRKYIRETEAKVVKRICSFENTLISIRPETLFGNRNYDRIKKCSYIIYLQISPKFFKERSEFSKDCVDEKLVSLTFTEKDKLFVEKSDIIVNCSKLKEQKAIKKIISSVSSFFRKQKKSQKKGE